MKWDFDSWYVWLTAITPMLGLGLVIWLDQRRRKRVERSPQAEKLLRPPGYSLSLLLDEAVESILVSAWISSVCAIICGFCLKTTIALAFALAPAHWVFLFIFLLALSAIGTTWFAVRTFRLFHRARNIRLGMRGEQAVAESLNETGISGFRVFHDLPAGDDWNIDHVAVGTCGVFLIETKARRRRGSRNGQGEHVVRYDGAALMFPFGSDPKPVQQAKRNAEWLSNFLTKRTGETVDVIPLVVLPGWFVEKQKGNFPIEVMNARYLVGFLQRQRETIAAPQVKRIIAALDEKCRDVEF